MKNLGREDFGYYEAPVSDEEIKEIEEKKDRKEYHNELEAEDKRLREKIWQKKKKV
jgi:hypothetical protein